MADLAIDKTTSIDLVGARRILCSQEYCWPRPLPIPAYDGQDTSWAKTALIGGTKIPATTLELVTVKNASFVIRGGFDGLILTKEYECVRESTLFSVLWRTAPPETPLEKFTLPVEYSDRRFGDVFLGFDAAWTNYFHWICYALAKSYIAARLFGESCSIVIPEYAAHASNSSSVQAKPLAYSESVWNQSLDLAGLSNRVVRLPPGIYEADRIHLIWPKLRSPTEIANTELFYRVFAELRSKLQYRSGMRSRVFISRKNARDQRIDATDNQALEEGLDRHGFKIVALETLSFIEQAELFYHAELVVGPHGAGLTNVLFGSADLKVLELNRRIGTDTSPRPWFYMLAAQRGLRYSYLDGTTDGFSAERVLAAIDNLLRIRA
jgi:Glycosyltransferase 61